MAEYVALRKEPEKETYHNKPEHDLLHICGCDCYSSLIVAIILWCSKDDEVKEHIHEDLPSDHEHLTVNQVNGKYMHEYVIDEYHHKWPRQ